jgi:crotonobetainyl-CoA:carnitine CoA-transferase CaiB-like acyl-CoA transferase
MGPFYHDTPDPEKSLYWFHFNTSKRSITLDIEKRDGQEILKRLVAGADFVVECFPPGHMDELGLGYSALEKINPRIIVASITPFGQTGPYRDYKAYDIVAMAMGGYMYLCGDRDRPPVRLTTAQSYMQAGAQAALGSMIAHWHRLASGEGQHIDVSMQECISNVLDTAQAAWDLQGVIIRRKGGSRLLLGKDFQVTYPCKDGYFCTFAPEDFEQMLEWAKQVGAELDEEAIEMARPILKKAEEQGMIYAFLMTGEEFSRYLEIRRPLVKMLTKQELLDGAFKRHFGWGPVNSPKDLVESPQLNAREFFVKVEHPELQDTLTYPGPPLKLSETPWRIWRRPPLIGEHNQEIYEKELGLSREELIFLRQAKVI